MNIGMVQMQSIKGEIGANIDKHIEIIEAVSDADALFFPELSLTGYEPALAKALATDQNDPRLNRFQSLAHAHQMTIGVGLPTKKGDAECISMVLFQPDKARRTYSKKYLHADEEPYFVSGDNFPVLTLGSTHIGLAICYELSVSAHAEAALANGAQVYIASVAKHARGMQAAGERLSQIAEQYGIPTLIGNSIGPSDNFVGSGGAAAWNSRGEKIGELDESRDGVILFNTVSGVISTTQM